MPLAVLVRSTIIWSDVADYDEAASVQTSKTYADTSEVEYDYTVDGKLSLRTWARTVSSSPLTTTYGYSTGATGTGELLTINYSDSTPDVTFTYDRRGNQKTVADAVGTRTFAYHTSGTRQHEDFSAGSLYHASVVKRLGSAYTDQIFVDNGGGDIAIFTFPRLSAVTFGTTGSLSADYSAAYHYDDNSDWMSKVTGPGSPTGGANYTYVTDSSLVSKTQPRRVGIARHFRPAPRHRRRIRKVGGAHPTELYGVPARACQESEPRWLTCRYYQSLFGPLEECNDIDGNHVISLSLPRCKRAVSDVGWYRLAVRWGWFDAGVQGPIGPGSDECRKKWTEIGCSGGSLAVPPGCLFPGCGTGCCSVSYIGTFRIVVSGLAGGDQ